MFQNMDLAIKKYWDMTSFALRKSMTSKYYYTRLKRMVFKESPVKTAITSYG
jgi:hypothetical protein